MKQGIKDRKLYFIINPSAGGGSARAWWEKTLEKLDCCGYDYFWEYTQVGQIEAQVKAAVLERGAQAIVVVGGDGSLFDALNGIVENDALIKDDLVFVAYPAGSACDFGKMLYAAHQEELSELLKNGTIRRIDLGRCVFQSDGAEKPDTRYFINSFDAGVGADTCVGVNALEGRMKKFWRSGKIAFMLTSLKVLMTYKYTRATVSLPDATFEGEYIMIAFGNGRFAGGGMMLFPKARIDDGLLDLLLIPKMSRPKILRLFAKAYDGSVIDIEGVIYCQSPKVSIATNEPIFVEMDGEVPGKTDVEVSVLPGFLPLLTFPEA